MGTRSTIQVCISGVPRLTMCCQYDGYLSGVGAGLLQILNRKHVNGYSDSRTQYNGPDNFCAIIVTQLMLSNITNDRIVEAGGAYIKDHSQHGQEEWTYTIDFEEPNYKDWSAEQLPPKISVAAYDFKQEKMSVEEFAQLIVNGLPDDEN